MTETDHSLKFYLVIIILCFALLPLLGLGAGLQIVLHKSMKAAEDSVVNSVKDEKTKLNAEQISIQFQNMRRELSSQTMAASLVAIALLLVITLIGAEYFSGRISRNLEFVAKHLAAMSEGTISQDLPKWGESRISEIRRLVRAYSRIHLNHWAMHNQMRMITGGDYDLAMPIRGDLATAFKEMRLKLKERTTQLKEAQVELENKVSELERANQELDQFTYFASHDLKEPLRALQAFGTFLHERYDSQLDDKGRHYLDVISSSAVRMKDLIDDLLKFSRISRRREMLEEVNMEQMLNQVLEDLDFTIKEKNAEIKIGPMPIMRCQKIALSEVFRNLISNGLKYNDSAKPVIEITCREKPEQFSGSNLFAVKDNGRGIEPQYHEKIFQIFQRLQRDDQGTGVGLTIVKKIIETSGGKIWLESEPGQGSTFYFTLPILKDNTAIMQKTDRIIAQGHR